MKNLTKIFFLLVTLTLLNISCRQEDFEAEGPTPERGLEANSNAANLMMRTAMQDGSVDNIIDQANCFTVALPVSLIVNDNEITIATSEDYALIEEIFELNDDDEDTLEIIFPVTIILANHTRVTVNDANQLQEIRNSCAGENEEDDDIECINIQYPLVVSTFNTDTQILNTASFQNDKEFFEFIDDMEESDVVTIKFPVVLILTDGSESQANDLDALEKAIDNLKDSCDEDDDYDFDDDDCNDCTVEDLTSVLTLESCNGWRVNKFKHAGENLKNDYNDFFYRFQSDGDLIAISNGDSYMGDWSADGIANDIKVTININDLTIEEWYLNKIVKTSGVSKVTFRLDQENELRFKDLCIEEEEEEEEEEESDCNSANCIQLESALTMIANCDSDGWNVSQFRLDGSSLTGNATGLSFLFLENRELVVNTPNGDVTYRGNWSLKDDGDDILLTMNIPIQNLSLTWPLIDISDDNIEKKVILGLDEDNKIIFQINCD